MTPTGPCYAIFKGVRLSSRPGFVEMINEPVRVTWYERGSVKELAVLLCGRSTRFPLATFQGEFTVLDVKVTA